jgi:hypothetical protein
LVATPIELVATVLQPIRPWDQRLTPSRGAHLVGPISVDKLSTASGVRAESPADLDDNSVLIPGDDLDVLSGWCDHDSSPLGQPPSLMRAPSHRDLVLRVLGQEVAWAGANHHVRAAGRAQRRREACCRQRSSR